MRGERELSETDIEDIILTRWQNTRPNGVLAIIKEFDNLPEMVIETDIRRKKPWREGENREKPFDLPGRI